MGINDRCAVGACSNARKYPEKYIIKPHIAGFDCNPSLRFWKCTDPNLYKKWTEACKRKQGTFKLGKNNFICSNHFVLGRPTVPDPVPTLFLKGYADDNKKRKPPKERFSVPKAKHRRKDTCESVEFQIQSASPPSISDTTKVAAENTTALLLQNYSVSVEEPSTPSQIVTPGTSSRYILPEVEVVSVSREVCNTRMSWHQIKFNNRWIKFYTGIPTSKLFMFIANQLRSKHQKLHYYNGFSDDKAKKYQISPVKLFCQKKPGPSRTLSLEDEILMTLMRIRLDSPIEDLSFRFQMSPANVSKIITTFLAFLSLELEPLIYWPTPDEILSYKHKHFLGTFNRCEGIGDCTEQQLQHSQNTDAQYQSYSVYKSRNTLKKLIFCTKSGSISYVSPSYGGLCTDRFIVQDTNIAAKFTPGFLVLFDKGFNVQDLFLPFKVKCVLPPFVRSKRQFTRSEVYHGKRIARARIHVERVMGRLKEFRLLENKLPINMIDMCDHIWNIAAVIVNLQPPLVK